MDKSKLIGIQTTIRQLLKATLNGQFSLEEDVEGNNLDHILVLVNIYDHDRKKLETEHESDIHDMLENEDEDESVRDLMDEEWEKAKNNLIQHIEQSKYLFE